MDDKIIEALREERIALLQKIAAIDATLAAYGVVLGGKTIASKPPQVRAEATSRTPSEKTQKIRSRVRAILSLTPGIPVPTRQLVDILTNDGFEIGGKKPIATLSALLSNSRDFESIGRQGWIVTEQKETPVVGASGVSETGEDNASLLESQEVKDVLG